jgi:hypothetical protein
LQVNPSPSPKPKPTLHKPNKQVKGHPSCVARGLPADTRQRVTAERFAGVEVDNKDGGIGNTIWDFLILIVIVIIDMGEDGNRRTNNACELGVRARKKRERRLQ